MIFHHERNTPDENHNWDDRMGFDIPLSDIAGLSRSDINSDAANVKFMIAREAGSVSFDGRFANGSGAGHFDFRASDSFVRTLSSLGFGEFKQEQLLIFTVNNLTTETV